MYIYDYIFILVLVGLYPNRWDGGRISPISIIELLCHGKPKRLLQVVSVQESLNPRSFHHLRLIFIQHIGEQIWNIDRGNQPILDV